MKNINPFGNPEGSRSEIRELLDGFVQFDQRRFGDGLGLARDDLAARVIVGARGTGKTVYLRRLRAAAAYNQSVYADQVQNDIPTTNNVLKFCERFKANQLVEAWSQLWYRAVIRALVSHLTAPPSSLSTAILRPHRMRLLEHTRLYPQFTRPLSCYSQAIDIINEYSTPYQYSQYFENADWHEVEALLEEILRTTPPVFLYLDELDAHYDAAPMHWLRCQEGLFYCVMGLLQNSRLGGPLHLVIGIREHVLASVMQREGAGKYLGESHIRNLEWTRAACRYFLEKKLETLDSDHLISEHSTDLFQRWLGHNTIRNVVRDVDEEMGLYLLRHTRMVPRDIVMLGNQLCQIVAAARADGLDRVPQGMIRDSVARLARSFGNDQLRVCANQIASSGMWAGAERKGDSELYTGDTTYVRWVDESLKQIIRKVGSDRFDYEEMQAFATNTSQLFGERMDVTSVLWQNRLLGYEEQGANGQETRFFQGHQAGEMHLPLDRREYVFHPCLIDAVGLTPKGPIPVLMP
jgi:hypothetical protein